MGQLVLFVGQLHAILVTDLSHIVVALIVRFYFDVADQARGLGWFWGVGGLDNLVKVSQPHHVKLNNYPFEQSILSPKHEGNCNYSWGHLQHTFSNLIRVAKNSLYFWSS